MSYELRVMSYELVTSGQFKVQSSKFQVPDSYGYKKKRLGGGVFWLSHQDSNLGKQNQNLMCYHYTMGQFL